MSARNQIAIVGAGGLGHPALWGLASSWPADRPLKILLIDGDSVELSNLNRQVLFEGNSIGCPKAEALAASAGRLNSAASIVAEGTFLTPENIDSLLGGATFVIDATDSVRTKLLINDYCVEAGIPFAYGGVIGAGGQVLRVLPRTGGGCLRCLFGEFTADDLAEGLSCRGAGIIGAAAGYLGFIQAECALDYLLSSEPSSGSSLYRFPSTDHFPAAVPASELCTLGCGSGGRRRLDLSTESCPMTYVFTKLALDDLDHTLPLEVHFSDRAAAANVCRSCRDEGHVAAFAPPHQAGSVRLIIAKRQNVSVDFQ